MPFRDVVRWGWVLGVVACTPSHPEVPVELSSPGLLQLDDGDVIEIPGRSLPVDVVLHLQFLGDLALPSGRTRRVDSEVELRSESPDAIVFRPSADFLQTMGRGTFRGMVFARFIGATGGVAVGDAEVEIDFPGSNTSNWQAPTEAAAACSWLGVEVTDGTLFSQDGHPLGVLVRSVAEGSRAERSGLKVGDHIVSANSFRLRTPEELRAQGAVSYRVRRDNHAEELELRVASAAHQERRELLSTLWPLLPLAIIVWFGAGRFLLARFVPRSRSAELDQLLPRLFVATSTAALLSALPAQGTWVALAAIWLWGAVRRIKIALAEAVCLIAITLFVVWTSAGAPLADSTRPLQDAIVLAASWPIWLGFLLPLPRSLPNEIRGVVTALVLCGVLTTAPWLAAIFAGIATLLSSRIPQLPPIPLAFSTLAALTMALVIISQGIEIASLSPVLFAAALVVTVTVLFNRREVASEIRVFL